MRSLKGWALAPTSTGATETGRNRSGPRRRGWVAAVAITGLVGATLAAGVAAPANAALGGPVGAIDGVNGFPVSYSDDNITLGQCLDGPQCLADIELPVPGTPAVYPDNFPIEHFYFAASAGAPAQPELYEAALEAAYANDAVVAGEEVGFGRIRVILGGLVQGATYRIQHPYGEITVQDNGPLDERPAAGIIRVTIDVGCLVDSLPCGAAGFEAAAAGFLGNSGRPFVGFLTQTNMAPGRIGDLLVPGTVTGAPTGLNAVTVTGPDAGGPGIDTLTVTDFAVQGVLVGDPVAPSTPTDVTATADNASALVRWSAPGNGGSTITGYSVQPFTAGVAVGDAQTVPANADTNANSVNVTGLVNGTSYTFQVTATNAQGPGASSVPSNTVTPATVASRPAITTATAGNASAVANWTAQADGGSAITGYHVRMVDAATGTKVIALKDATATARSLNFTGLANGTAVRFQVQARNALGISAVSAHSNAVTPKTTPSRPTIRLATAGVGTVTGNWSAPANGGSAITRYHVRVVDAATGTRIFVLRDVAGSARSLRVALRRGITVRFQVQAINAVGTGPVSAHSNAVTAR